MSIVTVRNEVAKVMFLHLSVSHSVHRGVCTCSQWGVPAHTPPESRYTPPGRYTTRAGTHPLPRQVHPPGRYTPWQVHPPGRYTPRAGTPPRQVHPPAGTPPRQVHPSAGTPPAGRYPPPPSRRLLLRTVRILLECILVRTVHHIKIHRTVILAVQGKFEVNKNFITNN